MRSVLVDAGALIARIDRGDSHHRDCIEVLKQIREPLTSVLPAVAEAIRLIDHVPGRERNPL